MREHKGVFKVLGAMQNAYYRSDERRERFVSLCHDIDVQRLTFEAYMNKKLVKARPLAHIKIGVKNLAHLTGLISARAYGQNAFTGAINIVTKTEAPKTLSIDLQHGSYDQTNGSL